MERPEPRLPCRRPVPSWRRSFARVGAMLSIATALGGCDPSDLKAWIEGNRDIPEAWAAVVPARAEEGLVDAKVESDYLGGEKLSLRYHDGEWTEVVDAFRTHLADAGYVELATCTLSDADADSKEVGSAVMAKPSDKGAKIVMPSLGLLIKSSGHFFIYVNQGETGFFHRPDSCTFTDAFDKLCEPGDDKACRFKSDAT